MRTGRTALARGAASLAMFTICVAATALAASASDYRPAFRPGALKGPPSGAPNEVLVLGTPHLSGLPDSFQPEMLEPLLARLADWNPTAIATEDLSGLQCDALRRYPVRYAETVKSYCFDPAPAALATGLDVPAANAEADKILADWPPSPSAAQRRRLAAVFLAAGEQGSALVQWLRLAPQDRKPGDGLDETLVEMLEKARNQQNETGLIGAALAARLGLERLWSVDDHSADTPEPANPEELKANAQAIMQAWDNPATQQRQAETEKLNARLGQPDGVMNLYRAYNASGAAMLAYRSDFGAALAEPSAEGFGRKYVGYWETRNLRMVANIRDVLGQHPGSRMLAIVGASHTGYYEAYLHLMHDVRLVDPAVVLK